MKQTLVWGAVWAPVSGGPGGSRGGAGVGAGGGGGATGGGGGGTYHPFERGQVFVQEKQRYAERTGANLHVVTQFGFDATAIGHWVRQLGARGV